MKSISNILIAMTLLLSFGACNAQIKNAKSENVLIFGNCGMCKSSIEKAGYHKKLAKLDWNKETKMAIMTYDSLKTNPDEILKRIALAGYDSEKFLAPMDAYSKLPECCQYERKLQTVAKTENPKLDSPTENKAKVDSLKTLHQNMDSPIINSPKLIKPILDKPKTVNHDHKAKPETKPKIATLKTVFGNYFTIKDALVKSDGNKTSAIAKDMLNTIKAVKMEALSSEEHRVWMKVVKDLTFSVDIIANTKNLESQRDHFITLSKSIYSLLKVSKQESPTYLQHCPMANDGKGADWLSKENSVKNPYYGSQMLTCGKTVETIK